jgi:hypothetical protein
MRKIAFAVAAVVVAAATPARAYDLAFDATGFAGAHFFSESNKLGRHSGSPPDTAFDHTGMVGFRVGFLVHERLSLEAELAIIPTTTEATHDSVLAFGWRAHALINILTGRVRPFVLVGGGGLTSSPANPSVTRQDTRGELHAGLGIKWDIRCSWGLRLDGRVQFGPATEGIYFTEDWEVTLGLYGRFGKPIVEKCRTPTPPTPPPPPQPLP